MVISAVRVLGVHALPRFGIRIVEVMACTTCCCYFAAAVHRVVNPAGVYYSLYLWYVPWRENFFGSTFCKQFRGEAREGNA